MSRPKGTPNRQIWMARTQAEASGVDPLTFLLAIVKADPVELARYGIDELTVDHRIHAASLAVPYCYPKLKSIELNINKTDQQTIDDIEALKAIPQVQLLDMVEKKIKEIKSS